MAYVAQIMPLLMKGTLMMAGLFALTLVIAIPLGLPIMFGSTCKFKAVRFLCKCYIWIFRGTPLLLQLFFFYYFPGIAFGIRFGAFPTAVFTFALNYAAYFAEIYRGGMNSIDQGQYEAAHSLGLSKHQTTYGIIIPQTLKVVLPPMSNEVITLIKDTALASVITLDELMRLTQGLVSRDVTLTPYLIAAAIYLLFTFLMTLISDRVEKHFSKYDSQGEW